MPWLNTTLGRTGLFGLKFQDTVLQCRATKAGALSSESQSKTERNQSTANQVIPTDMPRGQYDLASSQFTPFPDDCTCVGLTVKSRQYWWLSLSLLSVPRCCGLPCLVLKPSVGRVSSSTFALEESCINALSCIQNPSSDPNPISTSGIRSDSQMILTREGQVTPVSYLLAVGQYVSGFLEFDVSSPVHNELH